VFRLAHGGRRLRYSAISVTFAVLRFALPLTPVGGLVGDFGTFWHLMARFWGKFRAHRKEALAPLIAQRNAEAAAEAPEW